MPTHRMGRISNDMMREIADILPTVKDHRVTGTISVVRVEVARDLSWAKVFVSTVEGLDHSLKVVEGLKSAAGYIRKMVGQRMSIRKVPELQFVADHSIEYGANINRILNKVLPDQAEE